VSVGLAIDDYTEIVYTTDLAFQSIQRHC